MNNLHWADFESDSEPEQTPQEAPDVTAQLLALPPADTYLLDLRGLPPALSEEAILASLPDKPLRMIKMEFCWRVEFDSLEKAVTLATVEPAAIDGHPFTLSIGFIIRHRANQKHPEVRQRGPARPTRPPTRFPATPKKAAQ